MSSEWITINRKCETWERIKFSSLSEEKWSCWKQRNRRIACFFCELWGASYANVILRTLRRTANPQMQRSALTCDRLLASIHVYLSLDSLPFSRERERERKNFLIYSSSLFMLSFLLYRGLQFKACPSQNTLPFPRVCPTDFYVIASIPLTFFSYPVLLNLSVGDHLWPSKATTNKQI